ncbi:non-canonical purine NTP diphosphatase [Dysgonomonas sp. 25]|uniref:non-canonical purine NTP diphosphatase n=1 Tax=Dysgonomonas sp. 25 TaxID=2302933 RepID=UPI0013D5D62D|nr:non-canonical purine NTP diphosphatase [Dysgonomonas sp. 25]NDV68257.1 non-canonical purine NTP diphosphatase [Dysgonomonas sp. 25]
MKRKLVFATNNAHKLEEVSEIVKNTIDILSLKDIACEEDIAETGTTLEENAFIKVRYIKDNYDYDCFGDDTGLEVEALDGAPGVYSARYAGDGHDAQANMEKLLQEMQGVSNRKARFRSVIALVLEGKEYQFEGIVNGTIIEEKRGEKGFGYDPIFVPEGYDKTFAELGNEVKNNISHRALAVKALCDFLNTL